MKEENWEPEFRARDFESKLHNNGQNEHYRDKSWIKNYKRYKDGRQYTPKRVNKTIAYAKNDMEKHSMGYKKKREVDRISIVETPRRMWNSRSKDIELHIMTKNLH